MTSIRDLPSGTVSAIYGTQRAVERFDRAAATIATRGPGPQHAAVVSISDEARSAAVKSQQQDQGEFERALVDSMVAQHQLSANVRSIQTSDEMTRALLDLLGERR
jgi:hypothetical protein